MPRVQNILKRAAAESFAKGIGGIVGKRLANRAYSAGPRTITAYHGTGRAQFDEIRPGIHAGSRKRAAEHRLGGVEHGVDTAWKSPGYWRDYRYRPRLLKIQAKSNQRLGTSVRPTKDVDVSDMFPEELGDIRQAGFDTIIYNNTVEDPHRISYIFTDPSKLKIKDVINYHAGKTGDRPIRHLKRTETKIRVTPSRFKSIRPRDEKGQFQWKEYIKNIEQIQDMEY